MRCHNLKDLVCIRDQDIMLEKVVTTQGSKLKLKNPKRHSLYNRCRATFLSFSTLVLTRRLKRNTEGVVIWLLLSNHVGPGRKPVVYVKRAPRIL